MCSGKQARTPAKSDLPCAASAFGPNSNENARQYSGEAALNDIVWKPRTTKLQTYEAFYLLNSSFEATLLSFERLAQVGLFRTDVLREYTVILEHLRAIANEELTNALRENELQEAAHFDHILHRIEKERRDPDDVFLAAQARKRDIHNQAKALKEAFRQRPQRNKKT